MSTIEKEYLEILSLTKKVIEQNFSNEEFILSTPKIYKSIQTQAKDSLPKKQENKKKETLPITPSYSRKDIRENRLKIASSEKKRLANESSPTKKREKVQSSSEKEKFFRLEELSPLVPTLPDVSPTIKKLFPNLPIFSFPPNDQKAKKAARKWLESSKAPEIILLFFGDDPKEKEFLNNISKAISRQIAPSKSFSAVEIEKKKQWEALLDSNLLKLILAEKESIENSLQIMKYYKKGTKHPQERYLNNVPLFYLEKIPIYFDDISHKTNLWKNLLQFKEKNFSFS